MSASGATEPASNSIYLFVIHIIAVIDRHPPAAPRAYLDADMSTVYIILDAELLVALCWIWDFVLNVVDVSV